MLGVIALCVAFGLLALLLSLSRWLAHRPWAATGNLAVALALLLAAQLLWPPVLHLRTYETLRPRALIAQVQFHKQSEGKNFVILDAGMNDLARPAIYGAYHEIVPVRENAATETCDLVGPVCESADGVQSEGAWNLRASAAVEADVP